MMKRRTLLAALPLAALPIGAVLPGRAHAVSEVRYGSSGPVQARARALQLALGIPVRAVRLPQEALVRALDAGQLECAELDAAGLLLARALMGERLAVAPSGVWRRALPPGLGTDVAAALART